MKLSFITGFVWLMLAAYVDVAYGMDTLTLKDGRPLRVMCFNTWWFGQNVFNGYDKVITQIQHVNPDIALLQVIYIGCSCSCKQN